MKTEALSSAHVQDGLKKLGDWKMNSKSEIEKTFIFKDFKESLVFVGAVAWESERKNHHPDILIQWNKVTLALITHDAGGLTEKDFTLAAFANALI